jgi:hypothetical protein
MKSVIRSVRKVLTALALTAMLLQARPAEAQVLSGAIGGAAGIASGGYITLAVVVLRAQYGHYLHDASDLFGWQSVPVLLGAGVGAGVGVWDADRMVTGFAYGAAGTALGAGIGFLVGPLIWKRPEGKWAGGAIGAGVGMAAGYFLGVLMPRDDLTPEFLKRTSAIPISITLTVP